MGVPFIPGSNVGATREMLLAERRQLAAELTKSYQRGDGEKRERFTGIQSMIEASDRAALDEARM
jgi:CRISPR/Cas system CMR subunit Cmr4 (Cas7 group RAMP superfamily)